MSQDSNSFSVMVCLTLKCYAIIEDIRPSDPIILS
jgi:hypothetical protein